MSVVKGEEEGSAAVTIEKAGDKAIINDEEYTATADNTVLDVAPDGNVTLTGGGVELDNGKDITAVSYTHLDYYFPNPRNRYTASGCTRKRIWEIIVSAGRERKACCSAGHNALGSRVRRDASAADGDEIRRLKHSGIGGVLSNADIDCGLTADISATVLQPVLKCIARISCSLQLGSRIIGIRAAAGYSTSTSR